ncbi:hypothetical protein [Adhaeribacter aquaticus]|uniref:hypothetical protein n=1 Tax=Adhaeribacter aquaticus TaxID=299567 RepID=UPI00040F0A68|nr:hypothetical protein [Adhaeribacter aquaticus]
MEQVITLRKVFGEVFITIQRMPDNAFILAEWFGVQSVETVMQGGYRMLELIKEKPCSKLLNSNKNVIGSWDMALEWAQNEWTPQVRAAGLRYLAQVVPSSIYATMTIETLIQRINNDLEIRTFEDEAAAEAWLRSVPD